MTKNQFGVLALCASLLGCDVGSDARPDSDGSDSLGRVTIVSGAPEIVAVCAAAGGGDDWSCPDEVRVDCSATSPGKLEVSSPSGETCDANELALRLSGPLTLGTHEVSVRDPHDEILCTSDVIVERSTALQLVARDRKLWPPNHKLQEISVADCIEIVGACPGEVLTTRFVWASSDEPVDAQGDGHHEPDIVPSADCQHLSLRSERQGGSDGRVYSLGVRVVDSAGRAVETTCSVSVDHDQSGRKAQPGPDAYRIDFDGTSDLPSCGSDDLEPQ